MRVAKPVELTEQDRVELTRWARGRSTPARQVQRAKIVLAAASGKRNDEIAAELQCTRRTVGMWRNRFLELGIAGLVKDAPRSGRKPSVSRDMTSEILRLTTQEKPPGQTHWSTRTMEQATGVSRSTISRIWRLHNLKPHKIKTFKVSNDPRFEEKLRDVVGLYLNPPEHAIVLSCDEKSQIQALDRSQPGLPMRPGRLGTMTHDYRRNGTTTLFAALNVAEGHVITEMMPRHRHDEWIRFLRTIDRSTPEDLELHLIVDNYATHKHPKVQRWLRRHPRFHVHFTPTSSSWLNLVERWFRELTEKCIRRGVFSNVAKLQSAIDAYIEEVNEHSKPFAWTASPDDILTKVARAKAVLDKLPSE